MGDQGRLGIEIEARARAPALLALKEHPPDPRSVRHPTMKGSIWHDKAFPNPTTTVLDHVFCLSTCCDHHALGTTRARERDRASAFPAVFGFGHFERARVSAASVMLQHHRMRTYIIFLPRTRFFCRADIQSRLNSRF